ncbi:MAG: 16S rRNA (uracil(1498)-N(3))-methyltransferase [Candidatus Omnitrophica bacterium]|nr:16S rRNA (uracil(1498)-N(3))-methyltransferase [Candidatus Omnitrophota bacterium]
MHRFYCPDANFTSKHIPITSKDELHHLRDVLRLKKNAQVDLFDGKGREASGSLLSITSQKAEVKILSVKESKRQGPLLILACALPKKSKFEFIIEKATELGVDEIIPLQTQRTEKNLNGNRLVKKLSRYQTVAVNAAKQSQRSFVPVIHPVTDFPSTLDLLTKTTRTIIPSLRGKRENILNVFKKLKSPKAISFLIGPEGDFAPEEYERAESSGCIAVTLGETILKVETAAICTLSCANLFFRA